MTLEDLKQSVRDYLSQMVVVDHFIWSDQNYPRPDYPFMTIKFTGFSAKGRPYVSSTDSNGDRKIVNSFELFFSLQAFGENAMDNLLNIVRGVELYDTPEAFAFAAIDSPPTDLTGLIADEYIERAAMSLRLHSVDIITQHVDYFEKVKVIDNGNGIIIDGP